MTGPTCPTPRRCVSEPRNLHPRGPCAEPRLPRARDSSGPNLLPGESAGRRRELREPARGPHPGRDRAGRPRRPTSPSRPRHRATPSGRPWPLRSWAADCVKHPRPRPWCADDRPPELFAARGRSGGRFFPVLRSHGNGPSSLCRPTPCQAV